jgi:hypothetical protein
MAVWALTASSPTRATILTGRHVLRYGLQNSARQRRRLAIRSL